MLAEVWLGTAGSRPVSGLTTEDELPVAPDAASTEDAPGAPSLTASRSSCHSRASIIRNESMGSSAIFTYKERGEVKMHSFP